jgi:hypothetical protein
MRLALKEIAKLMVKVIIKIPRKLNKERKVLSLSGQNQETLNNQNIMDTTKIDENIGNDSIDSIDGVLNTISFTVPNIPIAPLLNIIRLGSNLRPGLSSESIL